MLAIKRLAGVAQQVDLRECMHIHYNRLCNANKAEPTLALKPKRDITRNPKQGYQWLPPKIGHVYVSSKNIQKSLLVAYFRQKFMINSSIEFLQALVLTTDSGRSFLGLVFLRVNPFLMSASSLSTMQPSSSDGTLLTLLPAIYHKCQSSFSL